MEWIERTDADHGERRTLFNAMIDKPPRVDAAGENPSDVVTSPGFSPTPDE
jgi:hypothetical protein